VLFESFSLKKERKKRETKERLAQKPTKRKESKNKTLLLEDKEAFHCMD